MSLIGLAADNGGLLLLIVSQLCAISILVLWVGLETSKQIGT
jgi:hypothetical protein